MFLELFQNESLGELDRYSALDTRVHLLVLNIIVNICTCNKAVLMKEKTL